MKSVFFQTVTGAVLTFGVGVALVVGSFGSVSNAEARVTGPRDTSLAQRCGHLQDEFDQWSDRYVATPAGSAGEAKAYQMMHNLENTWAGRGCDDVYGSISIKPIPDKTLLVTGLAMR